MDSDAAAPELIAVEDQVIRLRPYPQRIVLEHGHILVERRRERMVHGDVPLRALIVI